MTDREIVNAVLADAAALSGELAALLLKAVERTKARDADAASAQSRRYSCRKMRGVCNAVADLIRRGGKES